MGTWDLRPHDQIDGLVWIRRLWACQANGLKLAPVPWVQTVSYAPITGKSGAKQATTGGVKAGASAKVHQVSNTSAHMIMLLGRA